MVLYIADWSNPIINHGEVDFRDERRDRWHGRIWRVTRTGSTPRKRKTLPRLLRRTYCISSFLTIDIHVIKETCSLERSDLSEEDLHTVDQSIF